MVLFLSKQEKRIKKQIQQTEHRKKLFKGSQFANHWGFIPLVISLVFKRCADPRRPEPTGRGSLVGCHLWGRTELDTTEAT
uniref:Mitochondrial import receptor subunit TOM7 homolog n=1 Tax=Bos mutus grunniens TaxID=30521 RepID=A0A8B9WC25_BOSMU